MWEPQNCGRQAFLHTWTSARLVCAQLTLKRGVFHFRPKWEYEKDRRGQRGGGLQLSIDRLDFSVLDTLQKEIFTYIFQKYLEDMKTYFGAEPQSVNFVEASGQIRKEINSWVESQTEGKLSPRFSAECLLQALLYFFEFALYVSMCIS